MCTREKTCARCWGAFAWTSVFCGYKFLARPVPSAPYQVICLFRATKRGVPVKHGLSLFRFPIYPKQNRQPAMSSPLLLPKMRYHQWYAPLVFESRVQIDTATSSKSLLMLITCSNSCCCVAARETQSRPEYGLRQKILRLDEHSCCDRFLV